MSQIQQTGSTQNTPVNLGARTEGFSGAVPLDEVSRGDLGGDNLRYVQEAKNTDVFNGLQSRAPALDIPNDVKPTHLETASADINEISEITRNSLSSTQELSKSLRSGDLSPEQQAQFQRNSDLLRGAVSHLSNLHGHNVGSAEGKRSVLAGLGFNQSQLDELLSLANKNDTFLPSSGHNGEESLKSKKDALQLLGFSESQTKVLLSLAQPDEIGSAVGSDSLSLTAQGFSENQAKRLEALLNGQSFGTDEQKQLLKQLGFDDIEADVLLGVADPQKLLVQSQLTQAVGADQLAELQQLVQVADDFSRGHPVGDSVREQLVDIFTVLELLHEVGVQGRRRARETRAVEYDAAKQEILNQAGEVRKAAIYTLAAGVVSGTAKIAAGAVAIGGSFSGGSAAQASTRLQQATQASQLVSASGDIIAGGFNFQASEHQARQKEHEAFQKEHDNAAQSASEWMQLQQDLLKTVQSKLDEIIRTWFETLKTTTRG